MKQCCCDLSTTVSFHGLDNGRSNNNVTRPGFCISGSGLASDVSRFDFNAARMLSKSAPRSQVMKDCTNDGRPQPPNDTFPYERSITENNGYV